MLSLARSVAPASRLPKYSIPTRSFAQVTHSPPSTEFPANPPSRPKQASKSTTVKRASHALREGRIPVREDHGLYAFFRRKEPKEGEENVGDAKYEVVETPEKMQKVTGRSWRASELRLKGFNDLHMLWYILLRERNLLATQKEEARRMGVNNPEMQVSSTRVHLCRKSMARIKAVMNERRLAYEGAVDLIENAKDREENLKVQQYLGAEQKKERKYLQRRRAYEARKLASQQFADKESLSQTQRTSSQAPDGRQDDAPLEPQQAPQ